MATIYVAPNGVDSAPGTASEPKKTLDAAVSALRSSAAADTIVVKAGHYFQTKATVIGAADGNLTIQGEPGAIIHGGLDLTGKTWLSVGNGIYSTTLTAAEQSALPRGVLDLHVNGVRQTEARLTNASPNDTANHLEKSDFEQGWRFADLGTSGHTSFRFKSGDVPNLSQSDISDLKVLIYDGNQWASNVVKVGSIDYASRKVNLADNVEWHQLGEGSRYHLYGSYSFLDAPREWYYQKTTGQLYFKPDSPSLLTGSQIIAAAAETVIAIDSSSPDTPVNNVTVKGLTLVDGAPDGSNRSDPWYQFGGGAIKIVNGQNITVDGNKIESFGVGINTHSSNNVNILNNAVDNIAGNGIWVGKYWNGPLSTNVNVKGNIVTDVGHRFVEAGGIFILGTEGGTVTDNTVERSSQFGIYAGELRAADVDKVSNLLIQNNIVRQANVGTADGGGIKLYAQSTSDGVTNVKILDNWIDGTTYSMNRPDGSFYNDSNWTATLWPQPVAAGIYLDYNLRDTTISGNLITGGRGGVQINSSTGTLVSNNVLYDNRGNSFEINDTSATNDNESNTFSNNVVRPSDLYSGAVRIYDVDGQSLPAFSRNAYVGPAMDDDTFVVTAGSTNKVTGLAGFTSNADVLVNLPLFKDPAGTGPQGADFTLISPSPLPSGYFSGLSQTLINKVKASLDPTLLSPIQTADADTGGSSPPASPPPPPPPVASPPPPPSGGSATGGFTMIDWGSLFGSSPPASPPPPPSSGGGTGGGGSGAGMPTFPAWGGSIDWSKLGLGF